MELAKILDDGTIDLRSCSPLEGERMTQLREAGFLNFVPSEQPQVETGFTAVDSFEIQNGNVVQKWEVKIDSLATTNQIAQLKAELAASDYKVTKCYESSLVGDALPYDIEELHQERQSIRDEINRLEALLT